MQEQDLKLRFSCSITKVKQRVGVMLQKKTLIVTFIHLYINKHIQVLQVLRFDTDFLCPFFTFEYYCVCDYLYITAMQEFSVQSFRCDRPDKRILQYKKLLRIFSSIFLKNSFTEAINQLNSAVQKQEREKSKLKVSM